MLKELIDLMESHPFHQKVYSRCFASDDIEWEVYHNSTKFGKKTPWGLKQMDSVEWTTGNAEWLLDVIRFKKLNTHTFEQEIISIVKSTLVLAKFYENDVKRVLGKNIVNEAIQEYEDFTDELTRLLKHHLPERKEQIEEAVKKAKDNFKPDLKLI